MQKTEDTSEEIREHVMDMIRTGYTLEKFSQEKHMKRKIGISESFLSDCELILTEHKKGELKIECTEEDKKRIIRNEVLLYVKMGREIKSAKEAVKEDIHDGILTFIG